MESTLINKWEHNQVWDLLKIDIINTWVKQLNWEKMFFQNSNIKLNEYIINFIEEEDLAYRISYKKDDKDLSFWIRKGIWIT